MGKQTVEPDSSALDSPLRRSLSLPMLVLYGLGTTVGAGIYALVGEIAAQAGYLAPWSFLGASLLAGFTALSFAELSSRYPRAAGAALYVQNGFGSVRLATAVGTLTVLAGVVSSAALIIGFVGYLREFVDVDPRLLMLVTVTVIAALTIWGISQSVLVAGLISLVEVGGLIWIIGLGAGALAEVPAEAARYVPDASWHDAGAIFGGALLAFYAYIGFEDMVEVAEEVKDVRRTLPRAIVLTLVITTILYLLLMLTAIAAASPEALATSAAPLAELYRQLTGSDPVVITLIGLFAIINGAMIQVIMGSRILYGLAARQQLPAFLGKVNTRTRTPVVATLLVAAAVLILALTGRIAQLAGATSLIMLSVFAIVNLALWRIKGQSGDAEADVLIRYPRWIALAGAFVCAAFVLLSLADR